MYFKTSKLALIVVILTGILIFRFFQVLGKPQFQIGQNLRITGTVLSEPQIFGQSQYFSIDEFRIRTKIFPKYHYGDELEIIGVLSGNKLISFPKIQKVGQKANLLSPVLRLREKLLSLSGKLWPEPEASLFAGVILGQDTITASFRQVLINTGTIHIVVVSGQNVAMLAGFIQSLSSLFRKKLVGVVTIFAIIFYTVLTGMQPPTVRAAIMGGLAFVGRNFGRETWGFSGLAVAAILMLFFEPELIFDISFQLSVAATFGILAGQPILDKIFANLLPQVFKESLIVTLSAWVFTAPLIIFYFAKFTPITPFSNLLVLPVVPFLMLGGAFSLLASLVHLSLGQIVGLIPFAVASYFTFVVQNLSKWPFSTVSFPQTNPFLLLSFYLFLIIFVIWSQKKFLAKK